MPRGGIVSKHSLGWFCSFCENGRILMKKKKINTGDTVMWKSPCVNIWLCFCQSASKSESLSVTTTNFHLMQCSFPSPDRTERKYTEQARCLAISTVSSYPNGSLTLVRFVRVLTSLFKVAKSFNLTFKRKKKRGGGGEYLSVRKVSR